MKRLIVGLGNIGVEYENTRHNIGFEVVDALAKEAGVMFTRDRYAAVANVKFKNKTFILIKPATYMNLSGKAVIYWLKKENILTPNMLVVVDDIALPLGILRLKPRGSDAGHNGMISIIENLQSTEFPRLRFGIGDDFPRGHQSEFVLGKWTKAEEEIIKPKIITAVEIVKSFGLSGIDRTMNSYNFKK